MLIGFTAYAQHTSLTVDNQTPGWLSSKIEYKDQQTVRNLIVTGYINSTDLLFIGQLIMKHSLDGKLDLENANIVGTEKNEKDNVLTDNMFGISWMAGKNFKLKHLILPLSATESNSCIGNFLSVDTLTAGGYAMHIITKGAFTSFDGGTESNFNITNLILREGTDSIMSYAFSDGRYGNTDINPIKEVSFSSTLKFIGDHCFYKANLDSISLKENIEYIGDFAFAGIPYTPDTLFLPKNLRTYNLTSFNLKDGQNIYIPMSVENVNGENFESSHHLVFHLESTTPIPFRYSYLKCLSNSIVYIPKGTLEFYKDEQFFPGGYNAWSYAQLIEESCRVESVKLDKTSAILKMGENLNLYATVFPYNADNTSLKWSSDDEKVAKVDENGQVTALKSGKTSIKVVSVDNHNAKDSCIISVVNPVQEIKLNVRNVSLNVGDKKQLCVSLIPIDADNKEIVWISNNEDVATVSKDGIITGKGAGTAVITVTSAENEDVKDECEVTVLQPVTGIILDYSELVLTNIGETAHLQAMVLPEDASNKEVRWSSSKENVCTVSNNGTIIALDNGISVVTATTVDGGFVAVCTVTVDTTTDISVIETADKDKFAAYYTIDGLRLSSPQKGINIVKMKDGKTKRIIIK